MNLCLKKFICSYISFDYVRMRGATSRQKLLETNIFFLVNLATIYSRANFVHPLDYALQLSCFQNNYYLNFGHQSFNFVHFRIYHFY